MNIPTESQIVSGKLECFSQIGKTWKINDAGAHLKNNKIRRVVKVALFYLLYPSVALHAFGGDDTYITCRELNRPNGNGEVTAKRLSAASAEIYGCCAPRFKDVAAPCLHTAPCCFLCSVHLLSISFSNTNMEQEFVSKVLIRGFFSPWWLTLSCSIRPAYLGS